MSLAPADSSRLKGVPLFLESGAGKAAGFEDSDYGAGVTAVSDSKSLYEKADLILKVQPPTLAEAELLREGSTLVSFVYPLANLATVKRLAERGVVTFAMDLMPRISRAQSMDALSSQSTVSGYKAVLIAADSLPKLFPMLMTAAGTIAPARVLVVGAGVAGLQAIATARRLGAVVEAYDVRPAVKEQIESLGAKFVELPLDTADAQGTGGYAKAQSEEFYRKQQELLAERVRASDAVITTALVPGKKAPVLIPEDAVKGMKPGSVIVDIAAEQGGNCALTEAGKVVVKHGVFIHGPVNIPSMMPAQASQLYSRNVTTFLSAIMKNGNLNIDLKDELVHGALLTHEGKIVHGPTLEASQKVTK